MTEAIALYNKKVKKYFELNPGASFQDVPENILEEAMELYCRNQNEFKKHENDNLEILKELSLKISDQMQTLIKILEL